MKNKGLIISLIIIFSIIAVALVVIMFSIINGKNRFWNFKSSHITSNKLAVDEIYQQGFNEIKVEVDAGDIYMKESNDQNIRVLVYGDKDKTTVTDENGVLEVISKEKKCVGLCLQQKIAKIEVYLPQEYAGNIEIKNNYGDIKVGRFLNSKIKIEEDYGDVKVAGAKEVNVNNNDGDININETDFAYVRESAGDVKINNAKQVDIKNNYGDIEIGTITEYLKIEEDSGDIEIGFLSLQRNSSIQNNYGDIEIENTEGIYIDAKTDLGDVDVIRNDRHSNITLMLRNSCGDISVND